ncbi:MAG: Efflux transporter, RND family, MFP subunit [Candidatus Falkowbacteria bacterium GW2011_GWC2_38_22]|uniref:Efflux transporter, RND family, MFP subunit n=1 Tax=Candidatus Falkowbacteria bacterium GW2011_GWE1_38_31 TaxID=1618638 RepID=A0A0G0N0K9_9BACT|nr:MAG: Efflux transporter, RND family, MFP subunit [Candidatus Falkowbacteria bacterium GW2011_GWF2_38_1205]KKQ61632.1 MAG: Efflux transporter, RND family, MFP subunit [Candidatus Falkowbacteria bacterium GW2011_GWC2_38_22]KKQ63753.1 MAG: Efflux transporter, RND family, MFP subunit [Candidatus Falkowbacteria bacterium GW2011_GWF1_38_22]KKQ65831.1 MAG: Efflux transporter, RND family, MFP subunit [Candidatus Falkowbacteria bacterium GW2011_GWE2_38_254]KKQ70616.1 MAG: Efflux transporter, RND fami
MKLKKVSIIFAIIAVVIIGAVFFVLKNKPETIYTTVAIQRGSIIQSVSETGTVKSSSEIDLNFLNSGKIAKINFRIGDKVSKDAVLAELDCSDLIKRKEESLANLDLARASHSKLLSGATREEINVSKASVQQAKNAYEAAEKNLAKTEKSTAESIAQSKKTLSDLESKLATDITTSEQVIINAEIALENTKATYQRAIDNNRENAITTVEDKLTVANNALDIINKTINDDTLKDRLSVKDVSYLDRIDASYAEAKTLLTTAKANLVTAKNGANSAYVAKLISDTQYVLSKVFTALQYTFTALENTVISAALSQSSLDSFKSGISTQQTLISTAISAVQTLKQNLDRSILDYNTNVATAESSLDQANVTYESALRTARNALATAEIEGEKQIVAMQAQIDSAFETWQVAQSRYNQTIAPVNRQDILVSEAKIKQAQAALDTIIKNLDNCYIKAPIDGTVTKANYAIGEQPSGKAVFSMLGENNFEIEVLVSEADIAKVSKDDEAMITLDAFGEETEFSGFVSFIEPAETIIQDVVYYKVNVAFSDANKADFLLDIKSGMTANIIITTEKKENVLMIPGRAVIDKNGAGKFARVLVNGIVEERLVTLGLRGDGGVTELLSGVKEGENVVTYVSEK